MAVFLPWEVPWTRSLEGYSPWCLKELDWSDLACMQAYIKKSNTETGDFWWSRINKITLDKFKQFFQGVWERPNFIFFYMGNDFCWFHKLLFSHWTEMTYLSYKLGPMVKFLMSSLPLLTMHHFRTVFTQESRSVRTDVKQRCNVGRGKDGQRRER